MPPGVMLHSTPFCIAQLLEATIGGKDFVPQSETAAVKSASIHLCGSVLHHVDTVPGSQKVGPKNYHRAAGRGDTSAQNCGGAAAQRVAVAVRQLQLRRGSRHPSCQPGILVSQKG